MLGDEGSILVIIWHLLSNPEARYTDLGSDSYDNRLNPERRKRVHIHQLEAMGILRQLPGGTPVTAIMGDRRSPHSDGRGLSSGLSCPGPLCLSAG